MLRIITPGVYASIQDLGRLGYRKYGVPVAGAMDKNASRFANHILLNKPDNALLEITLGNIRIIFDKQTVICLTGAYCKTELNGKEVPFNRAINVLPKDSLNMGRPVKGVRSYLAIKDGFMCPKILGSRSFFKGLTRDFRLVKNMEIPYNENPHSLEKHYSSVKRDHSYMNSSLIEAYKGPEYNLLTERQKEALFTQSFKIAKENNRMAYRLEEKIPNELKGILTSAVLPGTVQLTPAGQLIVLMRDCQVTGGYPRILQLKEADIDKMAQKSTHDTFNFMLDRISS